MLKSLVFELPTCEICAEPYNSDKKVPCIIQGCGHTFCEACLLALKEDYDDCYSNNTFQCPTCRSSFPINSIFPKKGKPTRNYSLMQMIENFSVHKNSISSTSCSHGDPKFVCVDAQCLRVDSSCLKCFGLLHPQCEGSKGIPSTQLKQVYDNKNLKELGSPDWISLEKKINSIVEGVRIQLTGWLNGFKQILEKLRPAEFDANNFQKDRKEHHSFYSVQKVAPDTFIWKKTASSFARFIEFRGKIEEFFEKGLENELAKSVNQLMANQIKFLRCEKNYKIQSALDFWDSFVKENDSFEEQLKQRLAQPAEAGSTELKNKIAELLIPLEGSIQIKHVGSGFHPNVVLSLRIQLWCLEKQERSNHNFVKDIQTTWLSNFPGFPEVPTMILSTVSVEHKEKNTLKNTILVTRTAEPQKIFVIKTNY